MTEPERALTTMTYTVDGRIARITLNRPERGIGLVLATPVELAACVARAAEVGFRQAVRERDEPFGDASPLTFKG